jgi:sugar lactone lactonase YvrE
VTSNGDIYIDDEFPNGRLQKWIAKTNTTVTVMNVKSQCNGLFVDTNDTLYCSMALAHQVVKKSLNDSEMTSVIVAAGTGSLGSAYNELNRPWGIFVDVNSDLYVADFGNHRVQLFQSGELNGITVAGSTSPNPTINLKYPTGIVLDAEKYLFIVDHLNHRIVGSGLNGFRCLVGCYGYGSQSNQLQWPIIFSFDRSGNMFVADKDNYRIQKFEYLESCFGKLKKN